MGSVRVLTDLEERTVLTKYCHLRILLSTLLSRTPGEWWESVHLTAPWATWGTLWYTVGKTPSICLEATHSVVGWWMICGSLTSSLRRGHNWKRHRIHHHQGKTTLFGYICHWEVWVCKSECIISKTPGKYHRSPFMRSQGWVACINKPLFQQTEKDM